MLTTVRGAKRTIGQWIGAVRVVCNPGAHWDHLMVNGSTTRVAQLRGNALGGLPDLHTASWIQNGSSPKAAPAPN